jgi:hypothetical protein
VENIVSSAKSAMVALAVTGMSLVNIMNRIGDRHDPCGTPARMFRVEDVELCILVTKVRLLRKDSIILISGKGMSMHFILYNRP